MAEGADTLGRIRLFRSLDAESLRRLDTRCIWRRARAGEWVLDYQSGGSDVFFVLRGHVRVMIAAGGRDTILRDIGDGEFFGELSAIDGRLRSAGILAISDTVVARMSAAVFRGVLHQHADVCDQVLATLVAQIRMLANRVNEQTVFGVRERLYAELLRLGRPVGSQAVISPPPTHAELAARVSTHREAVSRELSALQRGGLIERRKGGIAILDPDRLKKMLFAAEEI